MKTLESRYPLPETGFLLTLTLTLALTFSLLT